MGANMARRLKDCGYAVTAVHDVHAPSADALAAEIGATSVRTLAEVTAAADVIFTVVTDDASPRDGRAIESIGRYNPQLEPSLIEIDEARAKHWLSKGAQPSQPVYRLLQKQGII